MSPTVRVRARFRDPARIITLATVLICLALTAPGVAAAESAATMKVYQDLRNAQPDGRTVTVDNLTLPRDAFEIRFEAGTFHLLQAVGEKTPGAVFLGRGSYSPKPGSDIEQAVPRSRAT
jgi:hypothetical protein